MRNPPQYFKPEKEYRFTVEVIDNDENRAFCSDKDTVIDAIADVKSQMENAYVSTEWRRNGGGFIELFIPLYYKDGTYSGKYEWPVPNSIRDNREKREFLIKYDSIQEIT